MKLNPTLKKILITIGILVVIMLFLINFFSSHTKPPDNQVAISKTGEVLNGESFIYENVKLNCSGVTRGEGEQIIDEILKSQLKYELTSHEMYAVELEEAGQRTIDIFISYGHNSEQLDGHLESLAIDIGNILKAEVNIIDRN